VTPTSSSVTEVRVPVDPIATATPHRLEVMIDLQPAVDALLPSMRPVDQGWQPSELLPDTSGEGWRDEIQGLRDEARELTDEMLVVLVGNVVTEEALPSYQTSFNRYGGVTDRTGVDDHPWARWSRAWTAEEKRHGDVTRAYVYLSGRVDLRALEDTIQHLLRNGFDMRTDGDPYRALTYAAFQEHATKTSWSQLGKLVGTVGAERLHRICGLIAADEARHERVYTSLVKEILRRDPDGAVVAVHETLGHTVIMPARTMTDGRDSRLFAHFADVGQRIGVYTLLDYAKNLTQLVETLGLSTLGGLTGEAAEARDAICAMPARFAELAEQRSRIPTRPVPFRWISGRRA
jgi:acyl-[acyl-carrier-protein] desaturase